MKQTFSFPPETDSKFSFFLALSWMLTSDFKYLFNFAGVGGFTIFEN